eukprot:CAMPEP_0198211578 /NCGR_PEP_ID=MMETSP1445-20131203/24525_1 /TAXON_ID=36898 /ORGANISM="Pyramimonas sp., Strain CCMP2087" /LENGTH=349 /DNA_ID=CAMNT_0043885853 /DNA_START=120 /DNA_END=1169 /DNA_ORIENTATION=+
MSEAHCFRCHSALTASKKDAGPKACLIEHNMDEVANGNMDAARWGTDWYSGNLSCCGALHKFHRHDSREKTTPKECFIGPHAKDPKDVCYHDDAEEYGTILKCSAELGCPPSAVAACQQALSPPLTANAVSLDEHVPLARLRYNIECDRSFLEKKLQETGEEQPKLSWSVVDDSYEFDGVLTLTAEKTVEIPPDHPNSTGRALVYIARVDKYGGDKLVSHWHFHPSGLTRVEISIPEREAGVSQEDMNRACRKRKRTVLTPVNLTFTAARKLNLVGNSLFRDLVGPAKGLLSKGEVDPAATEEEIAEWRGRSDRMLAKATATSWWQSDDQSAKTQIPSSTRPAKKNKTK